MDEIAKQRRLENLAKARAKVMELRKKSSQQQIEDDVLPETFHQPEPTVEDVAEETAKVDNQPIVSPVKQQKVVKQHVVETSQPAEIGKPLPEKVTFKKGNDGFYYF